MAGRKRNPDPSLFTTGELAVAVNLSPRNVILLCEREQLPIVSGGGGPGQHRLLDVTGFARAVVIGAFADAGLPMSEGVKVANAIWSNRSRQLPQALANYMSQKALTSSAFANQPGDIFATVYDGRHLIITKDDTTIRSYPNYMADPNQTLNGILYRSSNSWIGRLLGQKEVLRPSSQACPGPNKNQCFAGTSPCSTPNADD